MEGVITLRSDEKRVFEVSAFGPRDSTKDNYLLRFSFGRISFFDENLDTPYRSYDYAVFGCRDARPGSDCSDDMWTSYMRPDGPEEQLFMESPDRPFYLERDSEDPDLGRIVITFVPDRDGGSGDSVN